MSEVEKAKAAGGLLSASVVRSVMENSPGDRKVSIVAVKRLVDAGMPIQGRSIRAVVWQCDRWLRQNYRNDHVYRSLVLTKLLKEPDTKVTLPEFRVNASQADFLVVGTDLHIVEIKSDLDSLDRLARQFQDYRQVAPRVSVIAPARLARKVVDEAAFSSVGVSVLTPDGDLDPWRPAMYTTEHLNATTMMRSLRRAEYSRVHGAMGNPMPKLPNTEVFGHALLVSRTLDPIRYHDLMSTELAKRRPRAGRSELARVPRPLQPVVLRLNPGRPQLDRLRSWLDSEVERVPA